MKTAICILFLLALANSAYAAAAYYEGYDYPADTPFPPTDGWELAMPGHSSYTQGTSYYVDTAGRTYKQSNGNTLTVSGLSANQVNTGVTYDCIKKAMPAAVSDLFSSDGTFYVTMLIGAENSITFKGTGARIDFGTFPESTSWYGMVECTSAISGYAGARTTNRASNGFWAIRVTMQPGDDEVVVLLNADLANPDWDTPSDDRAVVNTVDFEGAAWDQAIELFGGGGVGGGGWIGGIDEIRIARTWADAAPYTEAPPTSDVTVSIGLQDYPSDDTQSALSLAPLYFQIKQGSNVIREDHYTMATNPVETTFHDLDVGDYDIYFSACKFLKKMVPVTVSYGVTNFYSISLPNGDVDQDGEIDTTDTSVTIKNLDLISDP